MVLPTAAEIPNHIPRTLRRRPRLLGLARASKVLLDAEALGVEDRSDGFGNWWSLRDFRNVVGNFAMIVGVGENASWK
jgi:hypothetical protein